MGNNILSAHRYIRTPLRGINKIAHFIEKFSPDIAALVEVDAGSFRTNNVDQAQLIASKLESYNYTRVKYRRGSFVSRLPLLRSQCNAILSKEPVSDVRYHYFKSGMKRLLIELEIGDLHIYLVHLALTHKTRTEQLETLKQLINPAKPCIVTGDFNTLKGKVELTGLCDTLNLRSANIDNLPTFPAWHPEKQLDFTLVSKHVKINSFTVPNFRLSDHLPLILDFEIG